MNTLKPVSDPGGTGGKSDFPMSDFSIFSSSSMFIGISVSSSMLGLFDLFLLDLLSVDF